MNTIKLALEQLENRITPSLGPVTQFHYTPGDNFSTGSYNSPGDPGSLGFNLAAIYSPQQLSHLPSGDKGLVYIGKTDGVNSDFINYLTPYLNSPDKSKIFGFYVADEPNPALVPASNLQAESDWLHNNFPGTKTFFVIANNYSTYTPQNTHMDLIGLDPYNVLTSGYELWSIPLAVSSVKDLGWNVSQIVPVYQAFGGAGIFANPTPLEEQINFAEWALCGITSPVFDYAYSWAEWGATSLKDRPDLQAVFKDHNENPTSLFNFAIERLQEDIYTRLALINPVYLQQAKTLQNIVNNDPNNGTLFGNVVEAQVDQLFMQLEN